MELHDRRIDRNCLADPTDGFSGLTALHLHYAQQVERIDMVRLLLKHGAVQRFGFGKSSLTLVR